MTNKKNEPLSQGVGRRKSSVASVYLKAGKGNFVINGKKPKQYLSSAILEEVIVSPLQHLDLLGRYDCIATVKGGGICAQAEAIRLGLSRALVEGDSALRPQLKSLGFLKRDSRKKERKKAGLAGARKAFQFSKR